MSNCYTAKTWFWNLDYSFCIFLNVTSKNVKSLVSGFSKKRKNVNYVQHQYLVIKQDKIKRAQLTVSGTNDSTF